MASESKTYTKADVVKFLSALEALGVEETEINRALLDAVDLVRHGFIISLVDQEPQYSSELSNKGGEALRILLVRVVRRM